MEQENNVTEKQQRTEQLQSYLSDTTAHGNAGCIDIIAQNHAENHAQIMALLDLNPQFIQQPRHVDSSDKIWQMFTESAKFSSPDLQRVWSALINAEIKNPGQITRKLINTVADFDQENLALIMTIMQEVVYMEDDVLVLPDTLPAEAEVLEQYGLIKIYEPSRRRTGSIPPIPAGTTVNTPFFVHYEDLGLTSLRLIQQVNPDFETGVSVEVQITFMLTETGAMLYKLLCKGLIDVTSYNSLVKFYGYMGQRYFLHCDNGYESTPMVLVEKPQDGEEVWDKQIVCPKNLKGINLTLFKHCEDVKIKVAGTDQEQNTKQAIDELYKNAHGTKSDQVDQLQAIAIKYGL